MRSQVSRCRRQVLGIALSTVLASAGAAQQVAEGLGQIGRQRQEGRWLEALESALSLVEAEATVDEQQRVAAVLDELGEHFLAAGDIESALRCCRGALATRQRILGDRDHVACANGLNNVAYCLLALGRAAEAMPLLESVLAMRRRLLGDGDHADLATNLDNVAACHAVLGRQVEALAHYEEALAMRQRLLGGRDDPALATNLNTVGSCLWALGRADEALPPFEAALAMYERLLGGRDDPALATSLNNVANCLQSLGRADAALPRLEAAIAMRRRLFQDTDHSDIAESLNSLGACLRRLGRAAEALPQFQEALGMTRRLRGHRDHPDVARILSNVAACLESLGHPGEALPLHEAARAMYERLSGSRDDAEAAASLNGLAACLHSLGRQVEALPHFEAALAVRQRLFGDRSHGQVATSLNNVATCLLSLGRAAEALPMYEAALAMRRRVFGDGDHPEVANSLNNVGSGLHALGRFEQALPRYLAAMEMHERVSGGRDHGDVATSSAGVAACLLSLGRADEALRCWERALAMQQRLFGDGDHPEVAWSLHGLARCLQALGRTDDALARCAAACDMIEGMRRANRTSPEVRQSFFDHEKRSGAFERLQQLAWRVDPAGALHAAERSRGRGLLDLLEQQQFDPLAEVERQARQRGDAAGAERLTALQAELTATTVECDRLLRQLAALAEGPGVDDDAPARRDQLLAESGAANTRLRRLRDERARLTADVVPLGTVRTPAEIQSMLGKDEFLLEFTVAEEAALLYVLQHEGAVEAFELPDAHATVQRVLPGLLAVGAHRAPEDRRGRDPDSRPEPGAAARSHELFRALVPADLWVRLQAGKRVFLVAHRGLHRLPFELLVTGVKDGMPVYWLDAGPPISYVSSGSVLHLLRRQRTGTKSSGPVLDLLAIGDPSVSGRAPAMPERGALVRQVNERGPGAGAGLRPLDVLLAYDGQPLADDAALRAVRIAVDAAVAAGERDDTPVSLVVWRHGEILHFEVPPGALGIQVGGGAARGAFAAMLDTDDLVHQLDLERLHRLPQLKGARAEAEAIADSFRSRSGKVELLLGPQATESAVFDLAGRAHFLHFACHGIAEEYAGQSLSMLVLTQPRDVAPEDDGLLKLGDLLHRWRGRLSSCRLVVLSACRTNVGPTLRDEAPQALPLGFMVAGAPAVISSLWAVDDASTRELMTDFYSRLVAGETDKLAAFTAAKKAMRARHPDPFHWAPFLFQGCPE